MRHGVICLILICLATAALPPSSRGAPAASIVVDSLDDAISVDGNCTLREALEAARTNTAVDGCTAGSPLSHDVITFSVDGVIFPSDALEVGAGITIQGNGQDRTILDGRGITTVIWISPAGRGDTILQDLTIRNGYATTEGAGIRAVALQQSLYLTRVTMRGNEGAQGGAIYVFGESPPVQGFEIEVAIADSLFSDNASNMGSGGALEFVIFNSVIADISIDGTHLHGNMTAGSGGAIDGYFASDTTLTIRNSALSGNQASGDGGALDIYNAVQLEVINSTVSGNVAMGEGGGIAVENLGDFFAVRNSTITGNAPNNIYSSGAAGGVAIFTDSLLANYAGENCDLQSVIINSLGYNLTDSDDCGLEEPTDTSIDPLIMQQTLGPLQNNGGQTPTHALLPGSPAIDAGNCSFGLVTHDQRGVPRPQGDGCDIGAFELQTDRSVFLPLVLR